MSIGIIVVAILITASLVVGVIIARRRQIQNANILRAERIDPNSMLPLQAQQSGTINVNHSHVTRPEQARVAPETDILPAYEPAPDYTSPSKNNPPSVHTVHVV